MGMKTDLMLEAEAREAIAEDIAVEAGILKRCPWHEIAYLDDRDMGRLYKIAAKRFKEGDIPRPFYSQKDIKDALKSVVDDAPLDCPRCEKLRTDD
jgi:hypothetical protein